MKTQAQIIQALHTNTCPLCGRHVMAAEYQGGKHYVSCFFCMNRWEVSPETKALHIRICDTITFRKEHGFQCAL